jgi:hypothetical protein
MMKVKGLILISIVAGALASATGCGSGDVDPGAKVDAPGYYNGPMKPRGQGGEAESGSGNAGDGQAAKPAGS